MRKARASSVSAKRMSVRGLLEDKPPPWLRGRDGLGHGRICDAAARDPDAYEARVAAGKVSGRTRRFSASSAARCGRSWTPRLGTGRYTIDCDVLQADGGTRTASITGAWVALRDCLHWMSQRSILRETPLKDHVAAVSCGIAGGEAVIDLDYVEDFERPHRREFRDDRLGRLGRSSGFGGRRALLRGRTHPNVGACAQWHSKPRRNAEGGSELGF